jgi:hypothetical protein
MGRTLGVEIVFVLTFVFLFLYFWGRRRNYNIQKNVWKSLRSYVKPYGKKVGFKGLGSSAFQISIPGRKSDSFKRLELTVSLLPRDILIHYFISKVQRREDEIIVKAQFRRKPRFNLEMFSRNSKMPEREETVLKEIDIRKVLNHLKALTSDTEPAFSIIQDPSVKKELKKLGKNLKFLSMSPSEPQLIFACSISPEVFPHVFPLVEGLASKVSRISMTGKC